MPTYTPPQIDQYPWSIHDGILPSPFERLLTQMPDTLHYYIDSPGLDPEHPHTNRDNNFIIIVNPDTESACFIKLTNKRKMTLTKLSHRFTPTQRTVDLTDEKIAYAAINAALEDDYALTLDDFRAEYPRLIKLRW